MTYRPIPRAATLASLVTLLAVATLPGGASPAVGATGVPVPQMAPAEAARLELDVLIDTYEELSEAPQRRADLGCRDLRSERCQINLGRVGALYVELLTRIRAVARHELSPAGRIDLDVLQWRAQLAVARYLDPDSNGFDEVGYATHILRHTGQALDPGELHELGRREIERIRQAMMDLVAAQKPDADLDAFIEAARTDDRLYAGSRQELRSIARGIAARIDQQLDTVFNRLPDIPYSIELL